VKTEKVAFARTLPGADRVFGVAPGQVREQATSGGGKAMNKLLTGCGNL